MILVDTSIWVDHFRTADSLLPTLLQEGRALLHPFVIGELAMGNLRQRESILNFMVDMPQALVASHEEVMHFVDSYTLFGRGIGYIDAHLLASTKLTSGCRLWTRDKRLNTIADELSLASSDASTS